MPSVAPQESRKLSSHTAAGLKSRMTAAAKPRPVRPSPRRPCRGAPRARPAIRAARSTLALNPARVIIVRQHSPLSKALFFRLHSSRSPSLPHTASRMERCRPETASRWLMPAPERAVRSPAGSVEVSAVNIAVTSAALSPLPSACSASTVRRRSCSSHPSGESPSSVHSVVSCRAVRAIPPESSRVSPSLFAPVMVSVPAMRSPAKGVSSSAR